jgi:hypothetical protein
MRVNRTVGEIITKALVLEHQHDIDEVLAMSQDACRKAGIEEKWTAQIIEHIRYRLVDAQDFRAGVRDCKAGIYDKWYRYHRRNDGAAYDKGWMHENKTRIVENVHFLDA